MSRSFFLFMVISSKDSPPPWRVCSTRHVCLNRLEDPPMHPPYASPLFYTEVYRSIAIASPVHTAGNTLLFKTRAELGGFCFIFHLIWKVCIIIHLIKLFSSGFQGWIESRSSLFKLFCFHLRLLMLIETIPRGNYIDCNIFFISTPRSNSSNTE